MFGHTRWQLDQGEHAHHLAPGQPAARLKARVRGIVVVDASRLEAVEPYLGRQAEAQRRRLHRLQRALDRANPQLVHRMNAEERAGVQVA